jgi:hypothetical protein
MEDQLAQWIAVTQRQSGGWVAAECVLRVAFALMLWTLPLATGSILAPTACASPTSGAVAIVIPAQPPTSGAVAIIIPAQLPTSGAVTITIPAQRPVNRVRGKVTPGAEGKGC